MVELDEVGLASVMEKLTWYELLVFMRSSKATLKTGRTVFAIRFGALLAETSVPGFRRTLGTPVSGETLKPRYYTIFSDNYSRNIFYSNNPRSIYRELLRLVEYIELTTKSTQTHIYHYSSLVSNLKHQSSMLRNVLYVAKDPLTLCLMKFIEDMEKSEDVDKFIRDTQKLVKSRSTKTRRNEVQPLTFNSLIKALSICQEIYEPISRTIYQGIKTGKKILLDSILEQETLELRKYKDFINDSSRLRTRRS